MSYDTKNVIIIITMIITIVSIIIIISDNPKTLRKPVLYYMQHKVSHFKTSSTLKKFLTLNKVQIMLEL